MCVCRIRRAMRPAMKPSTIYQMMCNIGSVGRRVFNFGAVEIAEPDHVSISPTFADSFTDPSVIARIQQLFQYSCESYAIAFAYGRSIFESTNRVSSRPIGFPHTLFDAIPLLSNMEKLREDEQSASQYPEWSVMRGVTNSPPHTPFKVSRSFAGLRPLSERLLKPPPQFICLTLRKLPELLLKLSLHLVPRAFDLKLVHGSLDI